MLTERVEFYRLIRIALLAGLVLVFPICQGCAQTGKAFSNLKHKLSFNDDLTLLAKGFEAHENNKIAEAEEIFQELYDNSASLTVRRQALYGLSICRLMMADTREKFDQARLLWQEWRRTRVVPSECADPVYLESFLMCKFRTDNKEEHRALENGACPENVSKYQYETVKNHNRRLKTDNEMLEEKYKTLKAEYDSLVQAQSEKDVTIRTLKDKIKALEDIDQKIQEKKNKTEFFSPE